MRCPHCATDIAAEATRCPQCRGEIRQCPTCGPAAVTIQEKWKGALRGGKQTVVTCRRCRKTLEGTRW